MQAAYRERGLVVLGVSVDDRAADMETFLDKNPVSFSVVRDKDKIVVSSLEPKGMPTTFLVDRHGTIRYLHTGFQGESTVKELTAQIEALLKEAP